MHLLGGLMLYQYFSFRASAWDFPMEPRHYNESKSRGAGWIHCPTDETCRMIVVEGKVNDVKDDRGTGSQGITLTRCPMPGSSAASPSAAASQKTGTLENPGDDAGPDFTGVKRSAVPRRGRNCSPAQSPPAWRLRHSSTGRGSPIRPVGLNEFFRVGPGGDEHSLPPFVPADAATHGVTDDLAVAFLRREFGPRNWSRFSR
jgi:hypothetical protein